MQQGPQSAEQKKQQVQTFLDYVDSHVEDLNRYTVMAENNTIDQKATIAGQVHYLRIEAGKRGVKLDEKQALLILQQATITVDQVLALEAKPVDPNKALAIRMAAALLICTVSPGIAGQAFSLQITREILHSLFDKKLGVYSKVVDAVCGLDMMIGSDYGIRGLGRAAATHMVEQYGNLGCLSIPLAILLYTKGPSLLKHLNNMANSEACADLIDMMGGVADDETYEHYRGVSLATMPIEDVASYVTNGLSSTLGWLWNKVPAMRSQAPVQAIETASEKALPRLH